MKFGTTLETERLRIRHWQGTEADRAFFHRVNSEEAMLEFFPFRRSRSEADAVLDQIRAQTEANGLGWAVAEDRASGTPIGFTGLAKIRDDVAAGPGVEIGWRYVPEAWGKGYASEAARALIGHGFDDLGLARIIAFAVDRNRASIAVMKRIGMRPVPERDFDHPAVPDDMPHLKRHVYYEIAADDPRP